MKKYVASLSAIILLLSISVVALAGHESMVIPYEGIVFGEKSMMPLPGGGDLRHHITSDEPPYRDWDLWPGKGSMYKGAEPHGAILTTYVNDIAVKSLKKKRGMRNNSIIVKENYTADEKLVAITVMYKVKGYNPEAGDWFWVKYDDKFNILKEGKVQGCISCHGAAKDNDYIFTGQIK